MGLWRMWSGWKDRFHAPHESDREAADRLSITPPEFWRPKDWSTSRRLRHQRQISIQNAVRRGRNPASVAQKYPEGPFWPRTPRRNLDMLDYINDARVLWAIEDMFGPGADLFQAEDGTILTWHPYTGMLVPVSELMI
jgi:hypothetical protein